MATRLSWAASVGQLESALLIPLDELRAHVADVLSDKPVVVVCQTGKRSRLGAVILAKAGFPRVASLTGGMMKWRELGLPLKFSAQERTLTETQPRDSNQTITAVCLELNTDATAERKHLLNCCGAAWLPLEVWNSHQLPHEL